MPKARHDVDYGPVWETVVTELGNPLGGEPTHSITPQFDRPDDVYGPIVTDHGHVVAEYVPWPDDGSDELIAVVGRLESTQIDVTVGDTTVLPEVRS